MSHRCGSPRRGAVAGQRRERAFFLRCERARVLLLVAHAMAVRVKGEPVLRLDVVSVRERRDGRVTERTQRDLVAAQAAAARRARENVRVAAVARAVAGGAAALERRVHAGPRRAAEGARAVRVDEEVHRERAHRLRHDEGERAAVEAPAVPVTPLRLALVWISGVSGNVHNDPDNVTETWNTHTLHYMQCSFISICISYLHKIPHIQRDKKKKLKED